MKSVDRFPDGSRTQFWRDISWVLGDVHANRICGLVTVYCRVCHINMAVFR